MVTTYSGVGLIGRIVPSYYKGPATAVKQCPSNPDHVYPAIGQNFCPVCGSKLIEKQEIENLPRSIFEILMFAMDDVGPWVNQELSQRDIEFIQNNFVWLAVDLDEDEPSDAMYVAFRDTYVSFSNDETSHRTIPMPTRQNFNKAKQAFARLQQMIMCDEIEVHYELVSTVEP